VPGLLGVTVKVVPEAIDVPPQLPRYHLQEAPVPSLPPLMVMVLLCPRQTIEFVPVILVAAPEVSLTVSVTDLQTV
jgi:hypothetical protein